MKLFPIPPDSRFLAIDFETASQRSHSACSIGLVRVENLEITHQSVRLIRPPEPDFPNTPIHGLTWDDVKDAPSFGELWPEIQPFFQDIDFLAAHNVGFDHRVLVSLSHLYQIEIQTLPTLCTVQLARKAWGIFPTKLPNVCQALGIELKHHDALSDALACAEIVRRASKKGQGP